MGKGLNIHLGVKNPHCAMHSAKIIDLKAHIIKLDI